jgi:hypothetical protein
VSEIKLTDDAGEKPKQVEKETEPRPVSRLPPRALGVPVPMPVLGHGWVPTVWGRR